MIVQNMLQYLCQCPWLFHEFHYDRVILDSEISQANGITVKGTQKSKLINISISIFHVDDLFLGVPFQKADDNLFSFLLIINFGYGNSVPC